MTAMLSAKALWEVSSESSKKEGRFDKGDFLKKEMCLWQAKARAATP